MCIYIPTKHPIIYIISPLCKPERESKELQLASQTFQTHPQEKIAFPIYHCFWICIV